MVRLSWNPIKSGLLINKREHERTIRFCLGGMETQEQLMPQLSLRMKEQKWKGPREVPVVAEGGGVLYTMPHGASGNVLWEWLPQDMQLTAHHCIYLQHPLRPHPVAHTRQPNSVCTFPANATLSPISVAVSRQLCPSGRDCSYCLCLSPNCCCQISMGKAIEEIKMINKKAQSAQKKMYKCHRLCSHVPCPTHGHLGLSLLLGFSQSGPLILSVCSGTFRPGSLLGKDCLQRG